MFKSKSVGNNVGDGEKVQNEAADAGFGCESSPVPSLRVCQDYGNTGNARHKSR